MGNGTTKFEKELSIEADALLESFFNAHRWKTARAIQFDRTCRSTLRKCLRNFECGTERRKHQQTAVSVLKILKKVCMDFHMRRVRHPNRLTLMCWEYDDSKRRYRTGGDKSRWEIAVCKGVGHVRKFCSTRFVYERKQIQITYQGRALQDHEKFRDVCVTSGSFINMIFLRKNDELAEIALDVTEMEHGTPQECLEKSKKLAPPPLLSPPKQELRFGRSPTRLASAVHAAQTNGVRARARESSSGRLRPRSTGTAQ
eukprot:459691_1